MNIKFIIALILAMMTTTMPVSAQGLGYIGHMEKLGRVNASKPEENARYLRGRILLTQHISDKRSTVIGKVNDVILDKNGRSSVLDIEMSSPVMGLDHLLVGEGDMVIKPTGNGYTLGLGKERIMEMLPILIANMDTAAGTQNIAPSVKSLQGAVVKNIDGWKIGVVKDVIFDALGGQAEYLLVEAKTGLLWGYGKGVSIPFSAASYQLEGKNLEVVIDNDLGRAMVDYSKN